MLNALMSDAGVVTGYVIGEHFLTKRMADMFFKPGFTAEPVYGHFERQSVITKYNGVAEPVYTVDFQTYVKFIDDCKSFGVELDDLLFIRCYHTDFDLYKTNGIWTNDRLKGLSCYCCVYQERIIGYILTHTFFYGCKDIYICMIEMLERNKGYGSLVIGYLKSRGCQIRGIATVSAQDFWIKQGAVLSSCNRFIIT